MKWILDELEGMFMLSFCLRMYTLRTLEGSRLYPFIQVEYTFGRAGVEDSLDGVSGALRSEAVRSGADGKKSWCANMSSAPFRSGGTLLL